VSYPPSVEGEQGPRMVEPTRWTPVRYDRDELERIVLGLVIEAGGEAIISVEAQRRSFGERLVVEHSREGLRLRVKG